VPVVIVVSIANLWSAPPIRRNIRRVRINDARNNGRRHATATSGGVWLALSAENTPRICGAFGGGCERANAPAAARFRWRHVTRMTMPIRLLESALYCDDLGRATRFYRDTLGLAVLVASERLVALDAGSQTVLLLFLRGASARGVSVPEGHLPPHDGAGPLHLAFAVPASELETWEARLAAAGVAIEHRVTWARGGTSVYFRDPDGQLVELATPGIWETY
jgi:catechol 2,3-dioxygenase-like lactoylglutathione lyase family enzyme